MLIKTICGFLLFLPLAVNAGFNGLTHHSRANCLNNESISWDLLTKHWLQVLSHHLNRYTGDIIHSMASEMIYTRRNGLVHWGEGCDQEGKKTHKWAVQGVHWRKRFDDENENVYMYGQEYVTDCSHYDGWWSKKEGVVE